jgi:hypothetical protein
MLGRKGGTCNLSGSLVDLSRRWVWVSLIN